MSLLAGTWRAGPQPHTVGLCLTGICRLETLCVCSLWGRARGVSSASPVGCLGFCVLGSTWSFKQSPGRPLAGIALTAGGAGFWGMIWCLGHGARPGCL